MLLMNHGFDIRLFNQPKTYGPITIRAKFYTNEAEAVCWAAAQGNDVALRLLLDRGCDPSSQAKYPRGSTTRKHGAVYWAIKYQKWNCAWLLLDKGANVHETGLLTLAVVANNLDLVERIVRKGASVDRRDYRPLSTDIGTLQKPNKKYWATLHYAAYSRSSDMVEFLLRLGAKVDISTPTGQTPLGISLRYSNRSEELLPVVELLIKGGASINHVDRDGQTALHLAILKNCLAVAKWLLQKGADVNHVDRDGRAPPFGGFKMPSGPHQLSKTVSGKRGKCQRTATSKLQSWKYPFT